MSQRTILVEFLIAGFFAIACFRTWLPGAPNQKLRLGDLFRFPGRLERLRRSRWQWFSMVALLLVVRMQMGAPLVLELMVVLQFIVFLALPSRAEATQGVRKG